MAGSFLKISRANGEIFYFNVDHVSMVYNNPADKSIYVTGTGYEKKFRPDEAAQLVAIVEGLCLATEAAPEAAAVEPAAAEPEATQ
jgi:hypothetical protein